MAFLAGPREEVPRAIGSKAVVSEFFLFEFVSERQCIRRVRRPAEPRIRRVDLSVERVRPDALKAYAGRPVHVRPFSFYA